MPAFGTQPLVLASTSPRRIELLRLLTPKFLVVPPKDDAEPPLHSPDDLLWVARHKAEQARAQFPRGFVIAADTGVFRDGKAYGKPRDLEQARQILQALSGGWHTVCTGLVVFSAEAERAELVQTRVKFKTLSPDEVEWYLRAEQVLDKAGAYAIQGRAALFVERLEGDFFNVMGLPVHTLYRLLGELGWVPWKV